MTSRHFGLIPAAGYGARYRSQAAAETSAGGGPPKQYQTLKPGPNAPARSMLEHSVSALLAAHEIDIVFVVLSPGDTHFRTLDWKDAGRRVEPLYCGGASRRDSVLNGLVAIADVADPDDWVLVHDAARPCLHRQQLRSLIASAACTSDGAILAVPVADTLKRADDEECISATEPRDGLWQAQTPQMFRHGLLMRALLAAPDVTDEAGAVERLGLRPKLVRGSTMNLKVTVPEDRVMAELILSQNRS